MRVKRSVSLPPGSIFHYVWRTVAGAFFLETDRVKEMFLDSVFKFYKRCWGMVAVYSFCVMSNHFHKVSELLGDPKWMSKWAHALHTSFSVKYNRLFKRRGPLGQDRFKSVIADDDEAMMEMMFYGDWNPVEAGIANHPREYTFSSYRFYAYGETNRWTRYLTRPQWYENLADTDEERQRLYIELCDAWWKEHGKAKRKENEIRFDYAPAFGSKTFVQERVAVLAALVRADKRGMDHRDDVYELIENVVRRAPRRQPPTVVTHGLKWRGPQVWEPPDS